MSTLKTQDVIGLVTGTRIRWTDEDPSARALWDKIMAVVEAGEIMRKDFEGVDWLSPGAQAYDKAKASLDEETT